MAAGSNTVVILKVPLNGKIGWAFTPFAPDFVEVVVFVYPGLVEKEAMIRGFGEIYMVQRNTMPLSLSLSPFPRRPSRFSLFRH